MDLAREMVLTTPPGHGTTGLGFMLALLSMGLAVAMTPRVGDHGSVILQEMVWGGIGIDHALQASDRGSVALVSLFV